MARVLQRLCLAALVGAATTLSGMASGLETRAHLLVHQEVLSSVIAVGENCTFRWLIVNGGLAEAQDITVHMPLWPKDRLDLVEGEHRVHLEALGPGEMSSHTFTSVPRIAGILEAKRMRIELTYTSEDARHTGSAELSGDLRILTAWQRRQQTSSYLREWTRFTLSAAIAVGLPAFAWATFRSRVKREFS